MTIEEVRERLPSVHVSLSGSLQVVSATVSGRKNKFATVTLDTSPWTLEYSWQAVARSLTSRTLLIANLTCH